MVEQPISFFVFQKKSNFFNYFSFKKLWPLLQSSSLFYFVNKTEMRNKNRKNGFFFLLRLKTFCSVLQFCCPEVTPPNSEMSFQILILIRVVWSENILSWNIRTVKVFFPCYVSFNVKGLLWEIDDDVLTSICKMIIRLSSSQVSFRFYHFFSQPSRWSWRLTTSFHHYF